MKRLIALALVAFSLSVPPAFSDAISEPNPASPMARGPADAPVKIVEYGDLSCPACLGVHIYMLDVLRRYRDKILYEFRQLPSMHQAGSLLADAAALCAAEQQMFWPYHDRLMRDRSEWSAAPKFDTFAQYANETGLDHQRFVLCLQDPKRVERLKANIEIMREAGVIKGPVVFIQGRKFGPQEIRDQGEQLIREAIR